MVDTTAEKLKEDMLAEHLTVFVDTLPDSKIAGPRIKMNLKKDAVPRCIAATRATPLKMQEEADTALKGLLGRHH